MKALKAIPIDIIEEHQIKKDRYGRKLTLTAKLPQSHEIYLINEQIYSYKHKS